MVRLFFILGYCLAALIPHVGMATAFVPDGQCAVIVASRQTLNEVADFRRENPNIPLGHVYISRNGWYAISAGTIERERADAFLEEAKQARSIPSDSYCSTGTSYTAIAAEGQGQRLGGAPGYTIDLFDEFDARPLVQGEKRILQTALSLQGFYTGTLDGVWGQGSQNALDRYAWSFDRSKPTFAHAVLALFEALDQIEKGDFEAIWFSGFDVTLQVPNRRMQTTEDTAAQIVMHDRINSITVRITKGDGRAAGALHSRGQQSHRSSDNPYLLRRDDLWVTSTDDGVHKSYLRSHYSPTLRSWTSVEVRYPRSSTAGNPTFIISSIENGRGRAFTIPDSGFLGVKVREFLTLFEEEEEVKEADRLSSLPQTRPRPSQGEPTTQQQSQGRTLSGSAFYVDDEGHLMTNAHVIEGCRELTVDGRTARVVAKEEAFDLAVLRRIDAVTPGRFLAFASEPPRLNADITISGFPLSSFLGSLNVNRGSVSSLQGMRGDPFQLQISAPVQVGNSGGPVVNSYGEVVGVVVAKLDAIAVASAIGEIPQNVNFAVRGEFAKALLAANSISFVTPKDRKPLLAEDLAELLRESTAFVLCRT